MKKAPEVLADLADADPPQLSEDALRAISEGIEDSGDDPHLPLGWEGVEVVE